MIDETILRETARKAVQQGTLPTRCPDRTWGGPSVGSSECAICALLVAKGELEFKIEFARGDLPGFDTFHVHVQCFIAWEFERGKVPGGRCVLIWEHYLKSPEGIETGRGLEPLRSLARDLPVGMDSRPGGIGASGSA
jgi:hypothetical protein